MTQKISRAQWMQIQKRVQQANYSFDPTWKCLIDGLAWRRCEEHTLDDQDDIIEAVKARFAK